MGRDEKAGGCNYEWSRVETPSPSSCYLRDASDRNSGRTTTGRDCFHRTIRSRMASIETASKERGRLWHLVFATTVVIVVL
jgi:hypothetical protein